MGSASDRENVSPVGRGESPVAEAPRATVPDFDLASAPESVSATSSSARPAGGWRKDYRVWLISSLLVLAVGLVFGQTVGHDFIEFDDQEFVYENTHVNTGFTLAGLHWAFTDGPFHEWYPLACLATCSTASSMAWSRRAPLDQRAAARGVVGVAVSGPAADDRPALAQRLGGGGVCHSSLARRIGGLGGRTARRAERSVFHADARRVRTVRRAPFASALSGCLRLPGAGFDVQADACHGPLRLAAARLLATESPARDRPAGQIAFVARPLARRLAVASGKDSALGPFGDQYLDHHCAATDCSTKSGGIEPWSLATRLGTALVAYASYLGQSFFPVELTLAYPILARGCRCLGLWVRQSCWRRSRRWQFAAGGGGLI